MSLSIWQILLVVVLFILLFGRGRIPVLMTDLAAGIRNFKQGMTEPEPSAPASPAVATTIEANQAEPSPVVKTASQERSV